MILLGESFSLHASPHFSQSSRLLPWFVESYTSLVRDREWPAPCLTFDLISNPKTLAVSSTDANVESHGMFVVLLPLLCYSATHTTAPASRDHDRNVTFIHLRTPNSYRKRDFEGRCACGPCNMHLHLASAGLISVSRKVIKCDAHAYNDPCRCWCHPCPWL